MALEYKLKFGVIGKLMDVMMVRSKYRKGMAKLLQGLKKHVEKEVISGTSFSPQS
ncbi:MAG: hypothetical protein GY940_35140 [bacterium]|nr:hypothetical protein [bacterium]